MSFGSTPANADLSGLVGDEFVPTAETIAYTRPSDKKGRKFRTQPTQFKAGCYICGEDHLWRYCTKKYCPLCGYRGHAINNCPRKKGGTTKNSIMQVSDRGVGTELSVILPARVADTTLEMVLDSGAGPSVIDLRTIRELGLERRIHSQVGKVYGVGQNPVHLVGNITLEIDLGDNQISRHSFGVLHGTAKTRILGRDLLKKFGSTEFDWESHRVRIGYVWKDTCAVLEGGDVLS